MGIDGIGGAGGFRPSTTRPDGGAASKATGSETTAPTSRAAASSESTYSAYARWSIETRVTSQIVRSSEVKTVVA